MALQILTVNPENGKIDVPIDSNIVIELDGVVDPFTVSSGISLYTKSDGLWSGPDLAQLDTQYSDVLDIQKENTYYPFTYQISGNTIAIAPTVSLIPNKEHYISIYPGNDATRYISGTTVLTPLVIAPSGNNVKVMSSYTGINNDTFEITFNSSDGLATDIIDVSKGIKFVGSFPFLPDEDINIGELTIRLHGTWDIDNSISIPVQKAVGLTSVYEVKFTTSKYTTTVPRSHKVEYSTDSIDSLKVIKTIPEDMSQNNKIVNPISIKFNKQLNPTQIINDKIKVRRIGMDTSIVRNINHYYRIEGDTLKIFMLSVTREM
jgi:hypothetical protein